MVTIFSFATLYAGKKKIVAVVSFFYSTEFGDKAKIIQPTSGFQYKSIQLFQGQYRNFSFNPNRSLGRFGLNRLSQSLLFTSLIISTVFTLRKSRVYASQVPCLRFGNAVFTLWECRVSLRKWHVYNLQLMMFWLTNMLHKGCKNVKTGAFLPQFCINIQNDKKIANRALFFHNVQINS